MWRPTLHLLPAILILGVACTGEPERWPVGDPPGLPGTGGTGGGGGGNNPDGGIDARPADGITGRVCRTADIRDLKQCDPVAGVTVSVRLFSSETTTTAADGTFALRAQPQATAVDLLVTDPQGILFPGARVTPLDASGLAKDVLIVVINKDLATAIFTDSNLSLQTGDTVLGVVVTENGTPLANATLAGLGQQVAHYDQGSATNFAPGLQTTDTGFALYPKVTPGPEHTVTISITFGGVTKTAKAGVVTGYLTLQELPYQ